MAKTATPAFIDSQKQPYRRHITLYKVALQMGVTYYLCDHDQDISAPDVTVSGTPTQSWLSFAHMRSEAKANADLQVDTLDVTIPNAKILFQGMYVNITAMAIAGLFDKATVQLLKWNANAPNDTPFWSSSWLCMTTSMTRRDVTLRLESYLSVALRQIPRTIFDEKCNNQLFDSWCGLLEANFRQTVTALTGSTTGQLNFTDALNKATNNYWPLGKITGTSGVNNGVVRSVKTNTLVAGVQQLTLLQPLPFTPNVGDVFQVVPGCDKSISTCVGTFNNLLGQVPSGGSKKVGGFRGFPRIPKPTDTL